MKQLNRRQFGGLFLVLFAMVLLAACQPASAATSDEFDYEQAAENQAARWVAMARYYEAQDMLNDFDYEQAADNHAARWQAMGAFYARHDMLNVDAEAAAEAMAFRWEAMARFYEKMGWLNR